MLRTFNSPTAKGRNDEARKWHRQQLIPKWTLQADADGRTSYWKRCCFKSSRRINRKELKEGKTLFWQQLLLSALNSRIFRWKRGQVHLCLWLCTSHDQLSVVKSLKCFCMFCFGFVFKIWRFQLRFSVSVVTRDHLFLQTFLWNTVFLLWVLKLTSGRPYVVITIYLRCHLLWSFSLTNTLKNNSR